MEWFTTPTAGAKASRHVTVDDARAISFMGPDMRVYSTPAMLSDVEYTARDLALTMLDAGRDTITGRIKDTIIRGGENIYPREIEEFLIRLPGVEEVYVFGIPDPTYGEEVAAWVRPAHGHAADAGAIREQCRGHIASYKIPKLIRIVTAFPVTASGKAQKFRMREIEIAEHSESR